MLEILLTILVKLQAFAAICNFLGGVGFLVATIGLVLAELNATEIVQVRTIRRVSVLIFAIGGFILLIPSPQDLFKARLSLIKYQLASPENVEKGQAYIERIGRELECKYLTDCEPPSAEKSK